MRGIHGIAIILAVLAAALCTSPAGAATPVSCSARVNQFLDSPVVAWIEVQGARMTARGSLGYASFTMDDGYQIEDEPLHTPAAPFLREALIPKNGPNAFTGYFHEVFTDRGNGDEDRWQFWVGRDGLFWLRSVTWGGSWELMPKPICYTGPNGQIIVTGHFEHAGSLEFWTFVIQRVVLADKTGRRHPEELTAS